MSILLVEIGAGDPGRGGVMHTDVVERPLVHDHGLFFLRFPGMGSGSRTLLHVDHRSGEVWLGPRVLTANSDGSSFQPRWKIKLETIPNSPSPTLGKLRWPLDQIRCISVYYTIFRDTA